MDKGGSFEKPIASRRRFPAIRSLRQSAHRFLFPTILLFCIGVYTLNNSVFDIGVLLGFILGSLMEENLRRAMLLSRRDPAIFVERPISLALLTATALLIVVVLLPFVRRKRSAIFVEEEG